MPHASLSISNASVTSAEDGAWPSTSDHPEATPGENDADLEEQELSSAVSPDFQILPPSSRGSEQYPDLPASGEFDVSTVQVEQVQLTLRRFEVVSDIEQYEVNLGAKVAECIGLMDGLSRLHYEDEQIRSRLSHLAAEASRTRELQYHAQFQFRFSAPLTSDHAALFSSRRPFRRPLSSSSRPLQRIGSAFYTVPSLTSSLFNTVWHAVHTGMYNQRS